MGSDYWTSKQSGVGDNSTITITTTTTIPTNTSITVTLFEDVSGDGSGASTDAIGNSYDNSASVTLAGGTDETNDLTGFDGGGSTNDYWAHFQIDGDGADPTLDSPTVDSFDAAAKSSDATIVRDIQRTIDWAEAHTATVDWTEAETATLDWDETTTQTLTIDED